MESNDIPFGTVFARVFASVAWGSFIVLVWSWVLKLLPLDGISIFAAIVFFFGGLFSLFEATRVKTGA